MKNLLTFCLLFFCPLVGAQTVIQTGNWDETSTWQSGNIADAVTEDVGFSSTYTVTLESGNNYTVGNIALGSNGTLVVDGTLSVGNNANTKNLTGNASRIIQISGSVTIWGDLILGDNAIIQVSGTLTVKGNVTLGNSAIISNSGTWTVDGDFTGGTSTTVSSSGPISVAGDVVVSTSSSLSNTQPFTANSCTGPASFCNNVLPVVLASLSSRNVEEGIEVAWITSLERNLDRFEIQRSLDGIDFETVGVVYGIGYDQFNITNSYTFTDGSPVAGKNYYRLKIVDLDGYTEYSLILMEEWTGAKRIVLYPNPSQGEMSFLKLSFHPEEEGIIRAINSLGQVVAEFKAKRFQSNISLPSTLNAGVYLIQYVSRETSLQSQLIVK